MSNVALHMRITATQVTDEDVDRRNAAVNDLIAIYSKMKSASDILAMAEEIAAALGGSGTPSDWLGEQIEEVVQAHSSSFIYSERPLEVGICSGLAAYGLISQPPTAKLSWTPADIMAVGLWSALSFQAPLTDPKREALRVQLLTAAQDRVTRVAEGARVRSDVPDFGALSAAAEELEKVPAAFKKATTSTIEALRSNAALDREELDFLWWAMLERSRTLNKSLMSLEEPVRVVTAGIEAAALLRKLPCDVHHELVLRSISEDEALDLASLLTAIGEYRGTLISSFSSDVLDEAPGVYPLLCALSAENSEVDGALVKRKASEWGGRALLEAAIFHIRIGTAGKL